MQLRVGDWVTEASGSPFPVALREAAQASVLMGCSLVPAAFLGGLCWPLAALQFWGVESSPTPVAALSIFPEAALWGGFCLEAVRLVLCGWKPPPTALGSCRPV